MTATEYIRVIAPEFNNVTDIQIATWEDFVKPFISKKVFGDFYTRALALLICHKLKMAGYGESPLGDIGQVQNGFGLSSISDGGTSISFASAGSNNLQTDAEYSLTSYGSQYLQLRKTVLVPIMTSGE